MGFADNGIQPIAAVLIAVIVIAGCGGRNVTDSVAVREQLREACREEEIFDVAVLSHTEIRQCIVEGRETTLGSGKTRPSSLLFVSLSECGNGQNENHQRSQPERHGTSS
jgi:hypothetical protein